jgi:hypothetical protein
MPTISMPPLYILAGNSNHVAIYMRERGLQPSLVQYVRDAYRLRGLRNPTFVVLTSFWDRPDAKEIWETLKHTQTDASTLDTQIPARIRHQWGIDLVACTKCGTLKPENEWCEVCRQREEDERSKEEEARQKARAAKPAPIKFKHIRPPKPENGGFKRIRP